MSVPPVAADPPDPGSIHFFVELYAPRACRAPLRALNALEAGVRASQRHGIDPGVARARLAWWQQEAERAAAGTPAHPLAAELLRGAGAAPLGAALLSWVLVTHAELDSACAAVELHRELAGHAGAARFALMAVLLQADAEAARALGRPTALLHGTAPAARAALCAELLGIAPALQPPLRPLLVWSVLALRRARRGEPAPPERAGVGRHARLGDHWLAWGAARAADAGRIRRLHEVTDP
ncbi:MAG: hypothetical protein IT480_17720 [Gammaproteobacteria bacterium]|nr:hypothetical protein [Gammaproteobacteria bacterium]